MNRIGFFLVVGIGLGTLGFADGFHAQVPTSEVPAPLAQAPRSNAGEHVPCEKVSDEEECRSRMDCAWKGYCHGVPR